MRIERENNEIRFTIPDNIVDIDEIQSFIDDDLISIKYQKEAYGLVKDIDKKDLLFVALSIQTGYTIWTGDLKLHKGLTGKGFDKIITTNELVKKKW